MTRRHGSVWPDLLRLVLADLAVAVTVLQVPALLPAPTGSARPGASPAEASTTAPGSRDLPAVAEPRATPGGRTASRPYPRLLIPSIGVDAYLESVGLDAAHDIAAPARPEDAAWYSLGPAPGESGDAIIDGHLDSAAGPAVFWKLGALRPGAAVTVARGGSQTTTYRVSALRLYAYDDRPPELFASTGAPRLSLITCAGAWDAKLATYRQRLVVEATL